MHGFSQKATLALLILLIPTTSFAAGFLIFEAGAKALGMGGALTAQADDPSAIFFNPAGITQLEGTNLYGGVSLIFAGSEFAGVDPAPGYGITEKTKTMLFTPINAYLTYAVTSDLAVGVGVFNPFGLGQEWENPQSFSGRYIVYDVNLVTFNINPTVAWSPTDRFSLGAGLQMVYADVEIDQYLQEWDPNGTGFLDVGTVKLAGDNGLDFGFNVGGRVVPDDRFIVGVSYRSTVKVDISGGTADFTQVPSGNAALDTAVALQFPPDQEVGALVELPWLLSIGGAYTGVEEWVFEIDFNITGWSTFDVLTFEFQDPSLNSSRVQDYETVLSVRSGVGYDLNDEVQLRGGFYYDPTPQPEKAMSPLFPDTDRYGLTFGAGYKHGAWTLDGFALFILTQDRDTDGQSLDDYNGTYRTFANVIGVNVGYRF
jgi:long-chain fatty acid transport protein